MITAYIGNLEIEDGDFILSATRFIVREKEIAYELTGSDEIGDFKADGIAVLTSQNVYVAAHQKIIYLNYNSSNDEATIQFSVVQPSNLLKLCHVEGQWEQTRDTWKFSGNLTQYKHG